MDAVRRSALLAVAVMATAGVAGAQAKACEINEGSPFQLGSAKIYLSHFNSSSGKLDEKPKHLANAVRVLTDNSDKISNQVGRNWLLAKALNGWMDQLNPTIIAKRGALGYTTNTDAPQNMLLALDTALTAVEAAMPECKATTLPYRNKPFAGFINDAIKALNEDSLAKADSMVRIAMLVSPKSPVAWNLLANIAAKGNQTPAQIDAMQKVVEYSGSDTLYAKIRRQAMFNLAVLAENAAQSQQGDAKKAQLAKAADLFRAYLKEVPSDPNAQQGLARALRENGDTAAVAAIYSEMLNNPGKFTDLQLFEAASGASSAKRDVEAVKLFQSGLEKNPYYRDALFNLSNTYFAMKQAEPMRPVLERLLEVDPNNPDNWRLYAGYWQIRNQAEKDAAKKRVITDSLLQNLSRSEKMPMRVSIGALSHAGANHTLQGSVENRGTKDASYTLKFDFLDSKGAVVASQETAVGPVAPGANASFTVKVQKEGIVAYRNAALAYTPLP